MVIIILSNHLFFKRLLVLKRSVPMQSPGIFVALGKTVKLPVVEGDKVVVKKCCEIGYTLDERICDGLYFARSLKLLEKYLQDPHLLETGLDKKVLYAE